MQISKEELKELYSNNSNSFVCEKLQISLPTLIKYLKELKIPLKTKGQKRKLLIIDK